MTTIAILLAAGALLLFLETILPGLIAGIVGFCCIVGAVILAYVRFDFHIGNTVLAIAATGLIFGTIFYVKYFPESRMAQLFISRGEIGDIRAASPELIHQTGETLSALRPSGTAVINGRRCDVISEGGFIEPGKSIKVVSIERLRVVVRPLEA